MRLPILAFAAGVIALQTQPELLAAWPFLLAGSALLGLGGLWRAAARFPLILVAGLLIGFGWAAWRAELRLADELPIAMEGSDVGIVGVIAGLPQGFANGSRFEFDVERVATEGAAVPGRIMLSWYRGRSEGEAELPPLRPGERWQLTVRLKRPHGNANPGGFDYEAWLLERNIRATGYVRPGPGQRLDSMVWRLGYAVERLRDAVRSRFFAALPIERYPQVGILVALAVGDQKAVNGGESESKLELAVLKFA
ncbi:ComEC/Rec2 family competence protein [Azonexus sp. IMCC34839]|uniref:ComEC/Rec2 family competence protein n=1 Tax=Azonexus sp. IMCC34839 TaxID=3133695 RepID=UPI00399A6BE2